MTFCFEFFNFESTLRQHACEIQIIIRIAIRQEKETAQEAEKKRFKDSKQKMKAAQPEGIKKTRLGGKVATRDYRWG